MVEKNQTQPPDDHPADSAPLSSPVPFRFILVSDLDHTMVQNEDPSHSRLLEFNRVWRDSLASHSALVFSTGRSLRKYHELEGEAPLLLPDVLICSVGSEIYEPDKEAQGGTLDQQEKGEHEGAADLEPEGPRHLSARPPPRQPTGPRAYRPLEGWSEFLEGDPEAKWDRKRIFEVATAYSTRLRPQVESEQRPHKVSFHLHPPLPRDDVAPPPHHEDQGSGGGGGGGGGGGLSPSSLWWYEARQLFSGLTETLQQQGLSAKVVCSGQGDVDLLPHRAGKGQALEWLLRVKWGLSDKGDKRRWPEHGVLVCGDSGNDEEQLRVPGVMGCVVANAHQELRLFAKHHPSSVYQATTPCAEAIVEAMEYHNIITTTIN